MSTSPHELAAWKASGEYITYGPLKHKIFVKQLGQLEARADKTLLMLHGFPESSFSFHKVVDDMLRYFDRVVLFDMLGYGWSDKPELTYSYSLLEQADTAFTVWKYFNLKGGHLISHDMGDSVATEIVARHENNMMPVWFSDGLQSLTFTNGSMVLDLSSLRITQRLLLSGYGYYMQHLVSKTVFEHQVRSAHGNDKLAVADIDSLWEANCFQDGTMKSYLTIKYLTDRKQFEKTRWLPALSQTTLPIHLCWGDNDAVACVKMVNYLKEHVCKDATVTIMKGVGHFCQVGSPEQWIEAVGSYYARILCISGDAN
eukprot:CFRG3218T1